MQENKTSTIGSLPINTLLITSKLIATAGILWGLMYWALGMHFPAIFPLCYTVIMAIVIALFHKGVLKGKQLVEIELLLILLLPAFVQWSIGSFVSSGVVVLWSLLAPTGSLLFQDFKRATRWFGAFVFIVIILIIYELTFPSQELLNTTQILLFSAMNVTAISGVLFFSLSYFVHGFSIKQEEVNKLLKIELSARKDLQVKTQSLESVLSEKQILIKEIHHRVKNNMQIIASLIALQVKNIKSVAAKHEIQQIRNRITSMALVHEMLYQSEDFSQIDYGQYIETLAHSVLKSMKPEDVNITYDFDIDQIKFNIDTAIPLGLLINELLTNAIKYAFPDGRRGKVCVSIKQHAEANELTISDDGVGFSFNDDIESLTTLGMRLVYSLVEQLDGTIVHECRNGTRHNIAFKTIVPTG